MIIVCLSSCLLLASKATQSSTLSPCVSNPTLSPKLPAGCSQLQCSFSVIAVYLSRSVANLVLEAEKALDSVLRKLLLRDTVPLSCVGRLVGSLKRDDHVYRFNRGRCRFFLLFRAPVPESGGLCTGTALWFKMGSSIGFWFSVDGSIISWW